MKDKMIKKIRLTCIFLVLVITTGCATSYQPMGFSGGYDDRRTSRNTFDILFSGNGYTSSGRSADLCLLRGAELSLKNRFKYFVIQSADGKIDNSSSITTGNFIPIGTGGFYMGSTSSISKPSNKMGIISFFRQPVQYEKFYNAHDIFKKISEEYYIDVEVIPVEYAEEFDLFKKNIKYDFLSPIDPNDVRITEGIDNLNINDMLRVSHYFDFELPHEDKEKFIEVMKRQAARIGADVVVYDDKYNRIKNYESNKNIAFMAFALKKLPHRLGINYDKIKLKDEIYVVDSYDQDSNVESSGLLIGDRILYIDDKEPQSLDLVKSMVKWEVGKTVTLTVVRNGKQIKIPLMTVANIH